MEQAHNQEHKSILSRLGNALGRLAEVSGAYNPYANETSMWVMDTGEGRAIAAGAEDLVDVDLDKAFEDFSGKLAFVLRARGIEVPTETL